MDALYRRAVTAYEALNAGKRLDDRAATRPERQATERASARVSKQLGKRRAGAFDCRCRGAAHSKMARRWLAFDASIDAQISVDGVTTDLPGSSTISSGGAR
jgi:hypothetical protein